MKTFFEKLFEKKKEEIEKIEKKNEILENKEFSLYEYILKNGKTVFVPEGFDIESYAKLLKTSMQNLLKLKTKTEIENLVYKIFYSGAKGLKKMLRLSGEFVLCFTVFENELLYCVLETDKLENPDKQESNFNIGSWFHDSYTADIEKLITNMILDMVIPENKSLIINDSNEFIDQMTDYQKVWYYNSVEENEIILWCIEINTLKNEKEGITIDKEDSIILIATNLKTALVLFNNKNDISFYKDLTDTEITAYTKLLKGELKAGDLTLQIGKSKSKLFSEIVKTQKLTPNNKLRETSRINFIKENIQQAEDYLNFIEQKQVFDKLTILYLNMKLNENSEDELKIEFPSEILEDTNFAVDFLSHCSKWEISDGDTAMLIQLSAQYAENETQQNNIIQLYENFRKYFIEKEKDEFNVTVFDIKYAESLIQYKKTEEANKLLKEIYEELPDEKLSDILPNDNTDLTGDLSGQALKVYVLQLLSETASDKEKEEFLVKITEIQPLNKKRLEHIESTNSTLSAKANKILELYEYQSIRRADNNYGSLEYKVPDKSKFDEKLKHPATRKKESFYSIQKWLSSTKVEDFEAVKSFADKLTAENNNVLYREVYKIKQIFNLISIEVYFAGGEKSIGVTGYEGNPPFVIVGNEHVDKNSKYYLNLPELIFAVVSEIVHVYFKHSRITSGDVWKGVADKGQLFIDTFSNVVSTSNLAGSALKSIPKLNSIPDLLLKTYSKTTVGGVMSAAMLLNQFYKKSNLLNSKTEKKQKLLAASRLMQYTADRAGLLFNDNLKAAIRAMLLTRKNNHDYYTVISENDLFNFITEKEKNGKFKHQNFNVRLQNLFSFYMSNDFDELKNMIINKKQ